MFATNSRGRLTARDLGRFPSHSLFDRVGRSVCQAGCLPRKELFEAWEVARRARRLFRGGRVVDLGGGHGLLAHLMLLLDDTSPEAVVVDRSLPVSRQALHDALSATWPRIGSRVTYRRASLDDIRLSARDVVVSCHACGHLTDVVLERAANARVRVAVLPCCHDVRRGDTGSLTGWMDGSLAVDAVRAVRLADRGYRIWTQTIPAAITPKNRLLLGAPLATT
jgi:hypothetical protein